MQLTLLYPSGYQDMDLTVSVEPPSYCLRDAPLTWDLVRVAGGTLRNQSSTVCCVHLRNTVNGFGVDLLHRGPSGPPSAVPDSFHLLHLCWNCHIFFFSPPRIWLVPSLFNFHIPIPQRLIFTARLWKHWL